MKQVLVVYYSQSGQLTHVTKTLTAPLREACVVDYLELKPLKPFPFPWDFLTFMGTFPEAVALTPCPLAPFSLPEKHYDLVILAYQPWFLSPSIPMTSFLTSDYAKKVLFNTPVITLIGCRNMWIMAQEKMKTLLQNLGAKVIDNIVLVDQGNAFATFITTPRWMMSGKKDALWGIFPHAGISEAEIAKSVRFGRAIKAGLASDKEKSFLPLCEGLGAVEVNQKLINSEKIGTKSFHIWGKCIQKFSKKEEAKRKVFILFYTLFLILMILTVVPLNMLLQSILRKLNKARVLKEKAFYERPSGNGQHRMEEFLPNA
ncbi:MAG: dialkylresorcinol condensing enzyme [Campylobacterales bacterium]|nr:dialkylresorcinol condensing enzyme [Campylobacterales bacterium]